DNFAWLSSTYVEPERSTGFSYLSYIYVLSEKPQRRCLETMIDSCYLDIQALDQCAYLKELSLLICIYLILSNYNITKKYLLCVSAQNRNSAQMWASLVHFKSRL